MPERFDGQVTIITGGALGIGGATARRLASEGARVLIADINDAAAAANVDRITSSGGIAEAIYTDVSVSADIDRMVEHAAGQWGRVDILVQNAFSVVGGESRIHGTAETVGEADWDWGMNVLAKALYLGAKYAVPHMRKGGGGSIVNLASVHSFLQEQEMLVYEAGKAAVCWHDAPDGERFRPRQHTRQRYRTRSHSLRGSCRDVKGQPGRVGVFRQPVPSSPDRHTGRYRRRRGIPVLSGCLVYHRSHTDGGWRFDCATTGEVRS